MSTTNKAIQEKMTELSELVAWFDSDEFTIEEALAQFKKADELAADIEKDLLDMKNEVSLIRQKFSEDSDA